MLRRLNNGLLFAASSTSSIPLHRPVPALAMTLVLALGLQLAGGVGFARHHHQGGMMRGALPWWDYWETQIVQPTGLMAEV